ncbi:hypothetical protein HDV00_004945 [Rhizophlyctis rosea]|nr:hypothetical protein HDV00_004945 [Rhizophlyctis rosea]
MEKGEVVKEVAKGPLLLPTPSFQILADILLLLFAHPNISVPDLLICERTCKQWLLLIRSGQHQIWKQKLVEAFPEGCLPVLYGSECWRDVAILWYAWRRPWTPRRLRSVAVEEIEVQDVLPPKHVVVRDVISFADSPLAHPVHVFGARPDGQVKLCNHHRSSLSSPILDIVFAETRNSARPISNILSDFYLNRSNIAVARTPLNDIFTRVHSNSQPTNVPHRDLHAFNETVLLFATRTKEYPYPIPNPGQLNVLRLLDRKQTASLSLRNVDDLKRIQLTRLNVLLVMDTDDIWVMDLHLVRLYIISSVEIDWEVNDWFAFYVGDNQNSMDVFHPKTQSFQRCRAPENERLPRLQTQREATNNSFDRAILRRRVWGQHGGYWFSVMEYPADGAERTGAGGRIRHYWRWVELD